MEHKIDNLENVARRVFDLYVNYRENYIEQVADGSYLTYKANGTYLGVGYVRIHLEGNRTFGIRDEIASKVMIFDIDEDNLKAVNGILEILREYDIPANCLQVFFSGNKGYHVTCYFDKPVWLRILNLFQACVMVKLLDRYPELSNLKVDLRPTPVYGVKLPLGIHRITGKRCCFCDKETFNHIESFDPIFTIEQFSRDDFNNIVMKKITDENNKNGLAQRAMKYSKSYGFNIWTGLDEESVEQILSEELCNSGTRHVMLFELCVRLKMAGVNQLECEEMLIDWMEDQDEDYYKTRGYKLYRDIEKIVEYIYEGKKSASYERKRKKKEKQDKLEMIKSLRGKLFLTKKEVKFILSFPKSKIWSVILFIMIYHKRGITYSTRWQAHAISTIVEKCDDGKGGRLQEKTVREYLKILRDMGFIVINTVKLSKGENPMTYDGDNFIKQDYYHCRYGNCPTEMAVKKDFIVDNLMYEDEDNVFSTEIKGKTMFEILLEAVNYYDMREELYNTMSKRNFKNLFGNNKKAA